VSFVRLLGGLVLLAAGLTACGPPDEPRGAPGRPVPPDSPGPLVVAASLYPLDEFIRRVAGEGTEVLTVVPPGVEPHDWEPAPQDLVRLGRARLLIVNGAGMEPWTHRLASEVAARGTRVVVTTLGLPLLAAGGPLHAHPTRGGLRAGTPGAPDPHVWLDPVMAQSQVRVIRDALSEVAPARKAAYAANAEALLARLQALDARLEAGTRACRHREIIVTHAAFGYLARRYRLAQLALLGVGHDAEPGPAELGAIVRRARTTGLRHVFVEPLRSPRLAETLAREIPATLLTLNPLEGLTAVERAAGKDYVAIMDDNLASLRQGLECQ
jgi:zinc transport system substrate-binding protein